MKRITHEQLNDLTHEISSVLETKADITVSENNLGILNTVLSVFLTDYLEVDVIEDTEWKTICVRSFGATMYFSFEEFAESTIQDEQVAIEIAERMLAAPNPGIEYPDNQDPAMPEAYCTYHILDADKLRAQISVVKARDSIGHMLYRQDARP